MDVQTKAKAYEVYGNVFLLARKLEYIMDKGLEEDGLTAKQWQVIVVVDMFFHEPPTLSEVGEVLSTTRQNVKQIALQLEKKGFMTIKKDPRDRRALRLRTTARNRRYWESRAEEHDRVMMSLFEGMGKRDINDLHAGLQRFLKCLEGPYREARGEVPPYLGGA